MLQFDLWGKKLGRHFLRAGGWRQYVSRRRVYGRGRRFRAALVLFFFLGSGANHRWRGRRNGLSGRSGGHGRRIRRSNDVALGRKRLPRQGNAALVHVILAGISTGFGRNRRTEERRGRSNSRAAGAGAGTDGGGGFFFAGVSFWSLAHPWVFGGGRLGSV